MGSERRSSQEGFTLIEVLVAMVILSIGLLGLEALGIGAARSVARAEDQSKYTLLATQHMEQRMQQVRTAFVEQGCSFEEDDDTGLSACAEVARVAPGVARVTVRVREVAEGADVLVMRSHVYNSTIP